MGLLLSLGLAAAAWFGWRYLRRRVADTDPRLSMVFWRNSLIVLLVYVAAILAGGFLTRLMVGFSQSPWALTLLVGFFAVWLAYASVWFLRFLPTTKPRPAWLTRSRGWVDVLGVGLIIGLAVAARLV